MEIRRVPYSSCKMSRIKWSNEITELWEGFDIHFHRFETEKWNAYLEYRVIGQYHDENNYTLTVPVKIHKR
jgi:hypothetical protein